MNEKISYKDLYADKLANKLKDDAYLDIEYNRLCWLRKTYNTAEYKEEREKLLLNYFALAIVVFIVAVIFGLVSGFGGGFDSGYSEAQNLFNMTGYVP
jgi:hypothetical protein